MPKTRKHSGFVKRVVIGMMILMTGMMSITGCGDKEVLVQSDFVLEGNGTTIRGIGPGSTVEELREAYPGVSILGDSEGDISYVDQKDENLLSYQTILISAFFVDGKHQSADQLCQEYSIDAENLVGYLSSSNFLDAHTVTYHFLQFSLEDGLVTKVESGSLDYNEEYGKS